MRSNKKKIKLIIFDAYGVALRGGYPRTIRYLSWRFKIPYQKVWDILYTKWFNRAAERKIGQEQAWRGAIRELDLPMHWKDLHEYHMHGMKLNPPVLKIAQRLRRRYITLLLSKNTRMQWRDGVLRLKVPRYFDYAVNTQNVGLPKASRETMGYVMRRFKVRGEEIIYIDDQENNLTAAREMGIRTIFYRSFSQFKRKLNQYLNEC